MTSTASVVSSKGYCFGHQVTTAEQPSGANRQLAVRLLRSANSIRTSLVATENIALFCGSPRGLNGLRKAWNHRPSGEKEFRFAITTPGIGPARRWPVTPSWRYQSPAAKLACPCPISMPGTPSPTNAKRPSTDGQTSFSFPGWAQTIVAQLSSCPVAASQRLTTGGGWPFVSGGGTKYVTSTRPSGLNSNTLPASEPLCHCGPSGQSQGIAADTQPASAARMSHRFRTASSSGQSQLTYPLSIPAFFAYSKIPPASMMGPMSPIGLSGQTSFVVKFRS